MRLVLCFFCIFYQWHKLFCFHNKSVLYYFIFMLLFIFLFISKTTKHT